MLLTPGQQLKLRHRDKSITATLIGIGERNLTLSLRDEVSLERDAALELEVARDNTLYMFQARLDGVCTGKVCAVELLGEPSCRERRHSLRIPTNLKAHYYKLFERSGEPACLQGKIRTISSSGALLTTEEHLTLERELMLMFDLPMGNKEEFTTGIVGRIVRKHQAPTGRKWDYGVEFNRRLALSG